MFKVISLGILIVVTSISILYFNSIKLHKTKYDKDKVIHIYFDGTTIPSFFQAMHLVQQPKNELKFVSWNRYNKFISKKLMNKYNIQKFDYIDFFKTDWFVKKVKKIHQYFPYNKILLYGNLSNIKHIYKLFTIIPRPFIEKVFFYEDSIGCFLWYDYYQEIVQKNFFPSTYYTTFSEYLIKQNTNIKTDNLVNIDIYNKFNELSAEQKQDFLELMGLNISKLEKIINNREFSIFLDQSVLDKNIAMDTINNLLKEKPEIKDMLWIYKSHPRCKGKLFNELKNMLPNIYHIEDNVPFEVFLLTKSSPKYVMGYSSSAFFNLKKSQILKYFERDDDKYLPYLKKLGILSDEQIIKNATKRDIEDIDC